MQPFVGRPAHRAARSGSAHLWGKLGQQLRSRILQNSRPASLLRCCNDAALADDLCQQAFLQAWQTIAQLRQSSRFGPWLKRLAVNTWLQTVRRKDPLRNAADESRGDSGRRDDTAVGMDLDQALATLREPVRLCVVMAYHEGMTHDEISDFTGLPVGTVKSHIRRGSEQLRECLTAYRAAPREETTT